MHKWKYRNPYDRTCELCDRHEQAFTHAWDLWRVYNEWKYTWWEEMYPPSTKACSGRFATWWLAQLSWLGLRCSRSPLERRAKGK